MNYTPENFASVPVNHSVNIFSPSRDLSRRNDLFVDSLSNIANIQVQSRIGLSSLGILDNSILRILTVEYILTQDYDYNV